MREWNQHQSKIIQYIDCKKFDLEFSVDSLFIETSADFDEGGARGLLLMNDDMNNGLNNEISEMFDEDEQNRRARLTEKRLCYGHNQ